MFFLASESSFHNSNDKIISQPFHYVSSKKKILNQFKFEKFVKKKKKLLIMSMITMKMIDEIIPNSLHHWIFHQRDKKDWKRMIEWTIEMIEWNPPSELLHWDLLDFFAHNSRRSDWNQSMNQSINSSFFFISSFESNKNDDSQWWRIKFYKYFIRIPS